jgi:4a-hydroxytetrahydrobiopterin dehydratase
MATDLAAKHCVPCEGGMKPLTRAEAEAYLARAAGWQLIDGEPLKIARSVKRKNFAEAMAFVNQLAALAEAEGHHPDFCVAWNRVKLELFTHNIGGLSENDFIMAAKINELDGGSEKRELPP